MELNYLIKGIIVGFSVAAPVGPIGILCIRRSIFKGNISGFLTGLGATTADVIYAIIAGFGFTFISSFLVKQQFWLQIIGAIFLLYLGIKTFIKIPNTFENEKSSGNGLFFDYLSTFFLTITNPVTILAFSAVFAGIGLGKSTGNYLSAIILVSGVFIGSTFWWFLLSSCVSIYRTKINSKFYKNINKVSGLIITGFALYISYAIIKNYV